MGLSRPAMGIVIAALVIMNLVICSFVVMTFSVKRLEYAIFYKPYVDAEVNQLQIDLSALRVECYKVKNNNSPIRRRP